MEDLTLLTISTQYGTAKFTVEDGIVINQFAGRDPIVIDSMLTPREFFLVWKAALRSHVNVLNAQVFTRVANETSYTWDFVERLDKSSAELVSESFGIDIDSEYQEINQIKKDRVDTMQNGDVWVSIGGKRIQWSSLKEQVEG